MILVLQSMFNADITESLTASAVSVLEDASQPYEVIQVPGAVELPVAAQKFIRSKSPEAVIALGCVMKGDTDHYEYVLKTCIEGLTRVALDESVPIIQGVLACRTREQALARKELGKEYAETALSMKQLVSGI